MKGFFDIHHHLVYGLDDGPQDMDHMIAMLEAAYKNCIIGIIATPHVTPGVKPFDYAAFLERLKKAERYCAETDLPMALYPGAEIMYTPHTVRYLEEEKIPTLAGTRYVLVEFLTSVSMEEIQQAIHSLLQSGYWPILAHVERYLCMIKNGKAAIDLKKNLGAFYQINASTVVTSKGIVVDRFVKRLFEEEQVDFVATDAHNTSSRPALMKRAYGVLKREYGQEYARKLTGVEGPGVLG